MWDLNDSPNQGRVEDDGTASADGNGKTCCSSQPVTLQLFPDLPVDVSSSNMWDLNDSPNQGRVEDDGTASADGNGKSCCSSQPVSLQLFPDLPVDVPSEMVLTPGGIVAAGPVASSSSSSSADRQYTYDVFLSFRGPDTRKGITSELWDQLQRRGIKTFLDEQDLEFGHAISPTLLKAIKESRFAIVILSRDYASSAWCLAELAEICECMKDQNRILPLFFDVEPSVVRYQKGSFKEAFCKHGQRYPSEKVTQWRDALKRVADFRGWNTQNFKTHKELVDNLVEFVRSKVPLDAIEPTGDFEEYEATTEAMDKVKEALTDDKITAIGVYGMGGVGKTSMVRHVAAQACNSGSFKLWIIVAISQSLDYRKVQDTLADWLPFKFEEQSEDGRAARLHKEIMRKEKLLIILDDVWNSRKLSKIGIPSYEELKKCKSKVIFTTRKFHVCSDLGSEASIPLNTLSEQDSWKLFLRNAGVAKGKILESTTFKGVAWRVAGECGGLPIALKAVAGALRDEDVREWERAARLLEKSQYANPNHEEEEENAFNCIRLSYDYLKNEDHKSCFLLCGLYPEDHEIETEDVFRLAIVKGLFRDADSIQEARGTADSVVKYLKDSSLLLEGYDKGFVKMHDVIRDTAIQIAKSEDGHRFLVKAGCGLEDWQPYRLDEGCTAISLMRNKIRKLPEEELVCPNLQILLLNENDDLNRIPEKFIQSLNKLMLLDLSNTGISSLPKSFSHLTNLQALYLDYCHNMIDISLVGKLKKLEILCMRECPLKELPREIGHLINLRILEVSGASHGALVTIPSKVISKLHKLEELYMLHCGFKKWGCEVEGQGGESNIGFDELAGLSYLKILQVCIYDAEYIPENVEAEPNWVYFNIGIGTCAGGPDDRKDHDSRSLFLDRATISTLPNWFINAVTKKTEKLEYADCEELNDILMEYDHGRLHELKHLTVTNHSVSLRSRWSLEVLMNATRQIQAPVFEKLEELHLERLFELKELCVGELPPGSFINLKEFTVCICNELGNVSNFLKRLPNLEKLHLDSLRKLQYVFGCEGFEPDQSEPRKMVLMNLDALRSICNGPAPRSIFRRLNTLVIDHCVLLQSLFASDVAQCLVHLEDLFLNQCPLLERVIETVKNEKTVLPKLKNLILRELPKLYGASATVDIECPSLKHLIVMDCPLISFSTTSSLFGDSQFSFSATASNYFGSTNIVKLNDPQLYHFLHDEYDRSLLDRLFALSPAF